MSPGAVLWATRSSIPAFSGEAAAAAATATAAAAAVLSSLDTAFIVSLAA